MADPHHASDDYVRGSQEISEQESTFDAFVGLTKWGSLIISATLL
ncbi:MAG: aa3-type cytochrome c oxidase subunit IV, partial [Brevundimonas sp.]|nr:aa3-type cytochrome c oxidase subunit IV [Brevundimonas sp.]